LIGTVERYDKTRGFGFIRTAAGSVVFVHIYQFRKAGLEGKLRDGDKLKFEVEQSPRGLRATGLARVE
jgi:CspA family cold shock protein